MLSIGLSMMSILLQHMIGGKGLSTVYLQCLHILVHGPGNNGVGERKFIVYKNMSSLSMIIHVSDLADRELYTKG